MEEIIRLISGRLQIQRQALAQAKEEYKVKADESNEAAWKVQHLQNEISILKLLIEAHKDGFKFNKLAEGGE